MVVVKTSNYCRKLRNRGRIQGAHPRPMTFQRHLICRQVSGSKGHLFGDGLAIWLTRGRAQPGPVFGNVGMYHTLGQSEAYLSPKINSMDWEYSLTREGPSLITIPLAHQPAA
jgi:hypothetical protein